MTLALTMGITIGVKNTMKMMVGELIGVLIVAGTAVVGGGAIISSFPIAFAVFKYGGGLYLMFVGYQMINSRGSLALNLDGSHSCLLYTSPSPRDRQKSRMPSSA